MGAKNAKVPGLSLVDEDGLIDQLGNSNWD